MVPDPATFTLMVLCGVAVLFSLTFTVRRRDGAHALTYWFTAKLAWGYAAGMGLAYLTSYYFSCLPIEIGYIMFFLLIGLFAVALVVRFRKLKKKGS